MIYESEKDAEQSQCPGSELLLLWGTFQFDGIPARGELVAPSWVVVSRRQNERN